jgi:putative endonuclease
VHILYTTKKNKTLGINYSTKKYNAKAPDSFTLILLLSKKIINFKEKKMKEYGGYIYIVSNKLRTVLYIGVTSGLYSRITEHKNGEGCAFTKKYKCTDIIYYEFYPQIEAAIEREKQLKKWNRSWKENLIKKMNPQLKDLYNDIVDLN